MIYCIYQARNTVTLRVKDDQMKKLKTQIHTINGGTETRTKMSQDFENHLF